MKPRLTGLHYEWMSAEPLQRIASAFSYFNYPLYFVGGCVRDSLVSKLVSDIDLATPANPDQIISILVKAGISYTTVGHAFGTVVAVINSHHYQITSFRVDVDTDGRWAKVMYTDNLLQDAARRDFTINALYLTPSGDLYDPENGIDDLNTGIVKFIGDPNTRITEDYLRILRFYRFYAYFGRRPADTQLLQACSNHAHNLQKISIERMQIELIKLFQAPHLFTALKYLTEGQILKPSLNVTVDPNICMKLFDIEAQLDIVFDPLLRMHVVFGEQMSSLTQQLKFSRYQLSYIKKLARYSIDSTKSLQEWLYRTGPELARAYLCLQALEHDQMIDQNQWEQTYDWIKPKFPLTGYDAVGIGLHGSQISRGLAKVEQWWLSNNCEPGRNICFNYLVAATRRFK